MNREQIIRLLQGQLDFAGEQNRELNARLAAQSEQIRQMSLQIESLTQTVRGLEETLKTKDASLEKARNTKNAIAKLLKNKSEKTAPKAATAKKPAAPSPKERGNNHARRKEYFDLEVREHDIYPSHPDFDAAKARLLKTADTVRYEFVPPRFIKNIYHVHSYAFREGVMSGQAPAAPFLNSNYDASFLAGILQLRYLYSMPVERIIKYFAESGFELEKPTAHNLVKKAARQFGYLEKALHAAILEDDYIHMDESYYTVLVKPRGKPEAKASRKVYFWAALAHDANLVEFFYNNGSRGREVMTAYLPPTYRGAAQTDAYGAYGILETDEYPDTIRIGCFQHCKRKFLDLGEDKDAGKIVGIINELYSIENSLPDLPPAQLLAYRQKQAGPVLAKLKDNLIKIKAKKKTIPGSNLDGAVTYALNELPALSHYLLDLRYDLDNNAIERINRYISISRRNSLFCGSHEGAERAALILSLACSCRLNGLNSFDYFKGLLTKLIDVNPNTSQAYLRNLLPDKWGKEAL